TPLYIYLFYTDAATPEIYTLSLHDALPICTGVAVAFGNHPAQHGDVGLQILNDGLFIQFDGTASRGALGRSVGQLERLFNRQGVDRKSTRLNSSHVKISYAVFCLKKKKHMR